MLAIARSLVVGALAGALGCGFASASHAKSPGPQYFGHEQASLIGFSKDETAFAYRHYFRIVLDEGDEIAEEEGRGWPRCRGYIDHEGKRFVGTLRLVLVQAGRETSFAIQDQPQPGDPASCTALKVAQKRLAEAKQALEKAGIDLKQKAGAELVARDDVVEWPGGCGRVRFDAKVARLTEEGPDGDAYRARMKGRLVMRHEPARKGAPAKELWSSKVDVELDLAMASWLRWGLEGGFLSPSQRTLVPVRTDERGAGSETFNTVSLAKPLECREGVVTLAP